MELWRNDAPEIFKFVDEMNVLIIGQEEFVR